MNRRDNIIKMNIFKDELEDIFKKIDYETFMMYGEDIFERISNLIIY